MTPTKQAYVSVVLPVQPSVPAGDFLSQVKRVDDLLSGMVRMHEIVLVARGLSGEWRSSWNNWVAMTAVAGPITLLIARDSGTTYEEAMMEGLARCVGDFILEWEGVVEEFEEPHLAAMIAVSEAGKDVVVASPPTLARHTRAFYSAVNHNRTTASPLQPSLGVLYSRAAVDRIVDARHAVRHRKVLLAQSGVSTGTYVAPVKRLSKGGPLHRLDEALDITLTATKLGTRLAYFLASFAAVGGLLIAAYAVFAALTLGNAPQGWVTLMVVTGLSSAAILLVLAVIGEMLSRILREVQRDHSPTIAIEVTTPRRPTGWPDDPSPVSGSS